MNDNQNFLDTKTILAIVLVGVSWFGWQMHLQQKYPKPVEAPAVVQTAPAANVPATSTLSVPTSSASIDKTNEAQPESIIAYVSPTLNFEVSSQGMGIKNVQLTQYQARDGSIKQMGASRDNTTFETGVVDGSKAIPFSVKQLDVNSFRGTAEINGSHIQKTMTIEPDKYLIRTEVVAINPKENFRGFTVTFNDRVPNVQKKSFLLPATDHNEFYLVSDSNSQRLQLAVDKDTSGDYPKSSLVSLGSQYFVQALLNKSQTFPDASVHSAAAQQEATATLKYPILNRSSDFEVKYLAYIGPKNLTLLKGIDEELGGIINFGMFSFIAHYLLKLMIVLHDWVGNWGLTIILLTLIVRALVLPFNVMSYKSMKGMQAIQPLIKEIREKHKNDQQRVSLETMNLMKTKRVNPLGGCLPMLLQFPIFLALYQVLGQSIELYQAPFGLWIKDLSLKDPFYVLPILMGVTLFLQQRITPNTMDPAQKKVLMFMPLLFSLFMINLPSGLTLYIFVSGLFGVTQQLYFMRDKQRVANT